LPVFRFDALVERAHGPFEEGPSVVDKVCQPIEKEGWTRTSLADTRDFKEEE
jgi:hypothetical protein